MTMIIGSDSKMLSFSFISNPARWRPTQNHTGWVDVIWSTRTGGDNFFVGLTWVTIWL